MCPPQLKRTRRCAPTDIFWIQTLGRTETDSLKIFQRFLTQNLPDGLGQKSL